MSIAAFRTCFPALLAAVLVAGCADPGPPPGGSVAELERIDVVQADALRWLEQDRGRFDMVFIDPPFSTGLEMSALARLIDGGHLADGARVYVEQAVADPEIETGAHFELLRSKTLGEVRMLLLGSV